MVITRGHCRADWTTQLLRVKHSVYPQNDVKTEMTSLPECGKAVYRFGIAATRGTHHTKEADRIRQRGISVQWNTLEARAILPPQGPFYTRQNNFFLMV